jgi:iduronate 2-sulfatase
MEAWDETETLVELLSEFRMLGTMRVLLTVLFVCAVSPLHAQPLKPNVLFVVVDDLKPTIGCYGDKLAKTPNIDRVAATGTLFERAYCMQALCAPSRNALLTGLRPEVLRIYDLGTNFRKRAPEVKTLPQWFKENGYVSHGVGKIFHVGHGNHEDAASWSVPHFQGKTVSYALPENRGKLTREEALFSNSEEDIGKLPRGAAYESADVPDDTYPDGQIANESIKRLRGLKESGKPFFLAVGFLRPHLPFCSPKKYWDLYDPAAFTLAERTTPPDGAPAYAPQFGGEIRQYEGIPEKGSVPDDVQRKLIHGYYAAASYADAQLGRVLDELEKLGLAENTIVIVWGDHGWHLGDHGMWCKHTNYEQATHAPLLISAPGRRLPQRTSAIVEFVDVYPTLCDLAGLAKPSHLQGESLVPILDTPSLKRTAAFQVYPRGSKETGPLLGHAVRTDRWRYVEWRKADGTAAARELYDLQNDPQETVNVAVHPENAEVVKEHASLLASRLAKPVPAGLKLLDLPESKPKVDRAELFAKKDKDGDGKLTREEFLANQPDPDEAPKRFPKFDTNKDGVLTREEFIAAGAKP